MTRRCLALAGVCAALAGCARHVVVERDARRIDDARSVHSSSDLSWTIRREPAPAAPVAPAPEPQEPELE
jgi:hypothetical protein